MKIYTIIPGSHKGGRDGEYQTVFVTDNETGRRRHIAEHRYLMANKLGRKLTFQDRIHHRNGIKDDNRLENLQLCNFSEHAHEHARMVEQNAFPDKICVVLDKIRSTKIQLRTLKKELQKLLWEKRDNEKEVAELMKEMIKTSNLEVNSFFYEKPLAK